MKTVRVLTDKDKAAFNKLASHPVQSWEWGDFRQENGNTVVRVGLFDHSTRGHAQTAGHGKIVEGHQLTIHKLPHTSHKLAMLLKGPLPSIEVIKFLKEFSKGEKIIFVRMEPNTKHTQGRVEYLKRGGAVKGRRFFTPETFVIDLTKSEEDLLKSFRPKTRYNIRLAQRHGVEVSEENSEGAFEKYLALTDQTAKRQNFFAHTDSYHKLMWKHLHKAGVAHLLTAKYKNETLASWILFVWHDTLYYPYGASSEKHKNVMAAKLMMWEAIKFGKKMGLKKFDLWGKEEGRGFTRFKEGYNPEVVEFVGTWDLVVNRKLYRIYKTAETLRWAFLKLPLPLPLPKPQFR